MFPLCFPLVDLTLRSLLHLLCCFSKCVLSDFSHWIFGNTIIFYSSHLIKPFMFILQFLGVSWGDAVFQVESEIFLSASSLSAWSSAHILEAHQSFKTRDLTSRSWFLRIWLWRLCLASWFLPQFLLTSPQWYEQAPLCAPAFMIWAVLCCLHQHNRLSSCNHESRLVFFSLYVASIRHSSTKTPSHQHKCHLRILWRSLKCHLS